MSLAREKQKEAAARSSLRFINDGDVVGLGSGSTASYAVRLLGELVRDGLKIRAVPTSDRTRYLAESEGIPLVTFDQVRRVDVTVDGADEVDPSLRLIKGRGGALLREKVVASATRCLIIVVDSSKMVSKLGRSALPVEVIAFAEPLIKVELEALGAFVKLRCWDARPYVTDEGHYILDCFFHRIDDPASLGRKLNDMPGVVGHGLFIDVADIVLVGQENGVAELRRPNEKEPNV